MYISKANNTFFIVEVAASISVHDNALSFIGNSGSQKRWHSIIGIVTAIVGNILISFALNIQRYAHIRLNHEKEERSRAASQATTASSYPHPSLRDGVDGTDDAEAEADEREPLLKPSRAQRASTMRCDDDDHFERTSYLQSPYWWLGILLMTIGEAGNFLAYGFAPASIVSPLGVVALISNCIIAPFMLKEIFRVRDALGVLIATAGAVTVVLSAKTQEKVLGPHEVWHAITRTEFEIYMGITIGLIAFLMWASPRLGYRTILIDLGLVGLFGGYTALSTKGVASMFSSTLWRAFTTPVTYALLAVLIGTAIMQVRYVNKALQRFDSTQVIPIQFVLFTLSVITGSAILYRDFEQATVESAAKFAGGCLLTFLGVSFITSGRAARQESEERMMVDESDEANCGFSQQASRSSVHPGNAIGTSVDGSHDEMPWSRRPSHQNFADPPLKEAQQLAPEILLTQTPDQSSEESASAVRNQSWRTSPEPPSRYYSSPVVPTEAHSSLLSIIGITQSPRQVHRSKSQENPHTHPNYQTLNPPPPDSSVKEHAITTSRASLLLIIPGPLSSPLSAGLSAVVADTLRKGVESPLHDRSRRSSRGRPTPTDGDFAPAEHGHVRQTSRSAIASPRSAEFEAISRRSGTRSLSNLFGEFLKGQRGGRDAA